MEPIITKPTEVQRQAAENWPIWEKEVSEFPWQYDEQETCLIIEGDVTVTNEDGQEFDIKAGDYVVFPRGMKCRWNIKKDLRKHYNFG